MTSTEERLGSENRYEGRWSLTSIVGEVPVPGSEVMVPGGKPMPLLAPLYSTVDITRCRSCGSMVAVGSEDLHESLHRP